MAHVGSNGLAVKPYFCVSSCLNELIECTIDGFDQFCGFWSQLSNFVCVSFILHCADLLDLKNSLPWLFLWTHSFQLWSHCFVVSSWIYIFCPVSRALLDFLLFVSKCKWIVWLHLLGFLLLVFFFGLYFVAFSFWFLESVKDFFLTFMAWDLSSFGKIYFNDVFVWDWGLGCLLENLLLHIVLLLQCLQLYKTCLVLCWLHKVSYLLKLSQFLMVIFGNRLAIYSVMVNMILFLFLPALFAKSKIFELSLFLLMYSSNTCCCLLCCWSWMFFWFFRGREDTLPCILVGNDFLLYFYGNFHALVDVTQDFFNHYVHGQIDEGVDSLVFQLFNHVVASSLAACFNRVLADCFCLLVSSLYVLTISLKLSTSFTDQLPVTGFLICLQLGANSSCSSSCPWLWYWSGKLSSS